MKIEITDAKWLHEHAEVTLEELVELSGLSEELLLELVDYGALAPINPQAATGATLQAQARAAQWRFTSDCVVAVQTVSRLREDFDLDANALSVALMLIERIHGLESELQELQCEFPQLIRRRQTR